MDSKLKNLKRLASSDPESQERYVRELERIVGLGELAEESKLKCLVENCKNHAHEGGGQFLLMQQNHPGRPIFNWDEAIGPLFICTPCYVNLRNTRKPETDWAMGVTMVQGSPSSDFSPMPWSWAAGYEEDDIDHFWGPLNDF